MQQFQIWHQNSATCGFFPIDDISLEYLRLTGRDEEQIRIVEEYCKANGLFYTADSKDPIYTDLVEIDLNTIESNLSHRNAHKI